MATYLRRSICLEIAVDSMDVVEFLGSGGSGDGGGGEVVKVPITVIADL